MNSCDVTILVETSSAVLGTIIYLVFNIFQNQLWDFSLIWIFGTLGSFRVEFHLVNNFLLLLFM